MKYPRTFIIASGLSLLTSCTMSASRQSVTPPVVQSPKPLVVPVGKNWQVKEEAPQLSDERGRLPFQTEQSLQPEGTKSVSPADKRKIDTTR